MSGQRTCTGQVHLFKDFMGQTVLRGVLVIQDNVVTITEPAGRRVIVPYGNVVGIIDEGPLAASLDNEEG